MLEFDTFFTDSVTESGMKRAARTLLGDYSDVMYEAVVGDIRWQEIPKTCLASADTVSLSAGEYHSPLESITLRWRVDPGRGPCPNAGQGCYKPGGGSRDGRYSVHKWCWGARSYEFYDAKLTSRRVPLWYNRYRGSGSIELLWSGGLYICYQINACFTGGDIPI